MRDIICSVGLIIVLFTIFVFADKNSRAQTEGFDVKTPTEVIADDSESLVKKLIDDRKDKRRKAVPKDILCRAKCMVVLPKIKPENLRADFTGTGLMSCLKINSDDLTPPLFYRIDGLKSFYESEGSIMVFVMDETGVKSVLANSIELTSNNSEPGKTGTEFNSSKSYITYAKPMDGNLEGYDLSASSLIYADKDTFKAYQQTLVPIEILLHSEDIPPFLRGFDKAVKEFRSVCK